MLKLSCGLVVTGWQTHLNCNLVLNCAGSPRRLLRQKLQDGKRISFSEYVKRPRCNIHQNRWCITRGTQLERWVFPWSLVATTSHILALKLTTFWRLMIGSLSLSNLCLISLNSAYISSTLNQLYSLVCVYHRAMSLWFCKRFPITIPL
jgi:hypothetical protein